MAAYQALARWTKPVRVLAIFALLGVLTSVSGCVVYVPGHHYWR